MRTVFLIFALLISAAAHASDNASVGITMQDGKVVTASPALLAGLKKQMITGTSHGKTASYEGYDLRLVLAAAGIASTESLRGKQLTIYLTVTAADGYKVVFGLTELDPTLGNTSVFLVDTENGKPLPASDGPWRLVVPGDTRSARWVRQVVSIRITD